MTRSRLPVAIAALAFLIAIGTVGYRLIEAWSWFDSFYFTLYTVATIGYGEPTTISQNGRFFTVALIIAGVGVGGYALSVLTQSIIQGELQSVLETRRMQRAIEHLENHYIICGAGRIGSRVARRLAAEDVKFLLVERDAALSERFAQEQTLILNGDATDEDVLLRAGIRRAAGLVCALPSDAENVYITLTARDLAPGLYIVARVTDDSAIPKMRKAGANKMISTAASGAHQITQALLRPSVADFIELTTKTEGLDLVMEELTVTRDSTLCGKSLIESNVRGTLNIIVISVRRVDGSTIFNPQGETELLEGDNIIAIGPTASIASLTKLASVAASNGSR